MSTRSTYRFTDPSFLSILRRKHLDYAISTALGLTSLLAVPALAQDEASIYEEELVLEEVIVSDSVPLGQEAAESGSIRVLSLAPLIGAAIRRIHDEESVSSLFR